MSKAPAFQFYPQDFLCSLDVQMMSPSEVGAYCLLLFNAWIQEKQGYLPNDESILKFISRLSDEEWESSKGKLLKKFKVTDDGEQVFNDRLISEKEKQKDKVEQAKEAGRKSGESRRLKAENLGAKKEDPHFSKDAGSNGRSTDVQRVFNERSTDVQPTFNGR